MFTLQERGVAMPIGVIRVGLDASSFINFEIPTPSPDGVEVAFTLANAYEAGTLQVFRDQLSLQGGGVDFTETTPNSGVVTVVSAPDADEVLWCKYIKQ